ncbi:MAG: hypothetical protein SFY92_08685 [Verrucomicrobiae bacterium]|nr:hypothetical protein [Verrucomicrobiae bacterium]
MQDPVTEWRQLQDAIEFAIQNNPLAACRNTPAYQARHEKELLQSFADRHAL